MRFLLIFIFACGALFSAPLKILSINWSENEVQIKFDSNITKQNFTRHTHKDGIFYSVRAELTIPRKNIELEKAQITIAQNSKVFARIVISTDNIDDLDFKIDKKMLILSFGKNAESSAISDLFASLDAKKGGDSAKTNSKNSAKKDLDSAKNPPKNTESKKDSAPKSADSKDSAPKQKDSKNQKDSKPKTLPKEIAKNKIVVLDAGHGGKDCGAKVGKVCEKAIVLNISKKTAEILKARGYKVFVTRSGDKYLSLTDRTKMANDKNADVFISIHANALDKKAKNYKSANGIETYFLSTARSERARKVAELENKDDIEIMNKFSKMSFLNSINSQRLLASNKLAIDVQSGMLINARKLYKTTLDGGVREGPFWVLAGALMPSILIEVGYMTNANDLKRLQSKEYQNALAKGIADGIDGYFLKNF
ncbi:N-acetylmuramoyl-L-alanine amidase family protein [Helicobacter sp. 23-1044]